MYRYIDTGKIYLYTYCMHVCIGTYVYLCIYEYVGIFSVYGVFVFVCVDVYISPRWLGSCAI